MNSILFFKKHLNKILFFILLIFIVLFLKECQKKRGIEKLQTQNDSAQVGVKSIRFDNGEIAREQAIQYTTIKELKQANKNLYEELLQLKGARLKPELITIVKVVYVDSGSVQNTYIKEKGSQALAFDYKKDGVIIQGESRFHLIDSIIEPDSTIFKRIEFGTGLILSVAKDKEGIERVVAKPYPYSDKIRIDSIDAYALEEYYKKQNKPKRIGVGPCLGYGINSGFQPSLFIGISVNYSIIRF